MNDAQRSLTPRERRAIVRATMPASVTPEHPDYTREVFSVDQAALYLCVDRTRVYADVAAGKLGCRKDGARRYRFSQADLDAWRLAHRIEPRAAKAIRLLSPVRSVGERQPLRLPAKRRFQ